MSTKLFGASIKMNVHVDEEFTDANLLFQIHGLIFSSVD
jgi:hypothetical protein